MNDPFAPVQYDKPPEETKLRNPQIIESGDQRIVLLNLEDDMIEDVDQYGRETLRLGIMVNERLVGFKFPRMTDWNKFQHDLIDLWFVLSKVAGNVQIPENAFQHANEKDKFQIWAKLMQIAYKSPPIQKQLFKLIFRYLTPRVTGFPQLKILEWVHERYIRKNIRIDQVHKLFLAILSVDDWVKKNAIFCLEKVLGMSLPQTFLPNYPKDTGGSQKPLKTNPSSTFDFF